MFVMVYAIVFAMGIYYINRLIERGPQVRAAESPESGVPSRPISASHDAGREALASRS
jgi:cytochrome d ubiquinol oxidase subunit I